MWLTVSERTDWLETVADDFFFQNQMLLGLTFYGTERTVTVFIRDYH
jgi:hypothetical protein